MKYLNRRTFLRSSLISAAGAVATAPGFANIILPRKKETLGVALVGLGYYSTDLLAPALQMTKNCHLAAIVTGTPSKAVTWKKRYGIPDANIYNYQTFDSIADNDSIDVVYIVLPPSMHAEYSIRAAKAGKHVWCEKPMALNEKECQAMVDAAKQNKVKLSIGYRMQHEPNTQRIISFGKNRIYGKVEKVEAAAGYYEGRSNHWKQKKAMGGGAMYDMGVYSLNAARYATGLEPISVEARQSTTRPKIYTEVDETMVFDLEFPEGVAAHGETSFGKGMNTLMVTCTNGWYKLEPFQTYSGINGMASDGTRLNQTIPNEQAKQMDEDALAIINNKPVIVPGEEGLRDIRVVEAIYRSARENRRVAI